MTLVVGTVVEAFPHTAQSNDDLSKFDGQLWKCVAVQDDEFGGMLRSFQMKPQFEEKSGLDAWLSLHEGSNTENIYQKLSEIFPAVEPIESYETAGLNDPRMQQLGYRFYKDPKTGKDTITLPDRDALLARWKKIREQNPDLPQLSIKNSVGIATDIEFVEALLENDGLLSDTAEFIHDHLTHLIPLFSIIFSFPAGEKTKQYNLLKEHRREAIKPILEKVREFSVAKPDIRSDIEMVLGIAIDRMTAAGSPAVSGGVDQYRDDIKRQMSEAPTSLRETGYRNYYKRRSGKAPEVESIIEIWKQIAPAYPC